MKSLFKRREQRKTNADWRQTRVQYDTIDRKRFARSFALAEAARDQVASETASDKSAWGLLIIAVAAYVFGLGAGGVHAQNQVIDTPIETRNQTVAAALQAHQVDVFIGDYWRILPISGSVVNHPAAFPLSDCLKLSSDVKKNTLFQSLRGHSFAYLLSSDLATGALEGCSSEQIVAKFGLPSGITIIAGTSENPKEQVLFYDHGIQPTPDVVKPGNRDEFQAASGNSLKPVNVRQMANLTCEGHRTILQVVAHEDDDLLFMNPDLLHAIRQGDCIRTVYITAGDAGSSKFYWLNRERGSEAAYSVLAGIPDTWSGQTVRFGSNRFATAVSPLGNSQITLMFMHLPDGKPDGQGFGTSGFESLAKLASGNISHIRSVDDQSIYSYDNLVSALQILLDVYQPDEVRTQKPFNDSAAFSDHSDHLNAGLLASAAFSKKYGESRSAPLFSFYAGYPIRELPANVETEDLALKEQAFFSYALYDGAVCGSVDLCGARGDYSEYLQRQYQTIP